MLFLYVSIASSFFPNLLKEKALKNKASGLFGFSFKAISNSSNAF
jgi:hypothetical protein